MNRKLSVSAVHLCPKTDEQPCFQCKTEIVHYRRRPNGRSSSWSAGVMIGVSNVFSCIVLILICA